MNYTVRDDRPFVLSTKPITRVKKTEESKIRDAYIDTHCFAASLDEATGVVSVKVTAKNE